MGHTSEGVLRRLVDEPFAVADAAHEHLEHCGRCRARAATIAEEAGWAARQLSAPQAVPDADRAWTDLRRRVAQPAAFRPVRRRWVRPRFAGVSLKGGAVALAATMAFAGTAAGLAIGGVFAPTHVAPVKVSSGDMQAIASLANLSDGQFPTPSGTGTFPFGTLRWSSSGQAYRAGSVAAAEAATGVAVRLPSRLPDGVGPVAVVGVQPEVTVAVRLGAAAGRLAGTTAVLHVGPVVVVGYGARGGGAQLPTLGVVTLPKPTATSSGATVRQLESFLLSRPGVPSALTQELRMLGDPSAVLPIPVPSGLASSTVRIGRWPGVVVTAPSGVASGVVWEDGTGTVRIVAGLLDRKAVLGVAGQLR